MLHRSIIWPMVWGCLLLVHTHSALAADVLEPRVDERFELISVAFRLAECEEYASEVNAGYTERIQAHFGPHEGHELIRYVKKLRRSGIGFDAGAVMAVHVGPAPRFEPKFDAQNVLPDERWTLKSANKFVELLRAFYTDSRAAEFFEKEQSYYQVVLEAFRPVYQRLDQQWYARFYGWEGEEDMHVVVAPANGRNNYGPHMRMPGRKQEVYAIVGTWNFSAEGIPVFDVQDYFPYLLHEFNHSFVNPLLEPHVDRAGLAATPLFHFIEPSMRGQGYGTWEVMVHESIVRAAVVSYMMAHDFDRAEIAAELEMQFQRGFLWTDSIVDALQYYDAHRVQYPSLKEFYPEILRLLERQTNASTMEAYRSRFAAHKPVVEEVKTHATTGRGNQVNVVITFSQPMQSWSSPINKINDYPIPELRESRWSADGRELRLTFDVRRGKKYGFELNEYFYRSITKVPLPTTPIFFEAPGS